MQQLFVESVQSHPSIAVALVAVASVIATYFATRHGLRVCDVEPQRLPLVWSLVGGALTVLLAWSMFIWQGQATPEVQPGEFWKLLRFPFHTSLICLLVAVTATDQRTYWIPDSLVAIGSSLALTLAAVSGEMQIVHVWVDWNQEVPQLQGPFIPELLSRYPHWHGVLWSLAGIVCGAGVTWLARWLSSWVLGEEALGFGDVTLMAMIGAYLGWQPTLIVFLLAPLCAIVVGLIVRLLGSRTYIPYGPYLSVAAVLVMIFWRWIWMLEVPLSIDARPGDRATQFALRRLFGDVTELGILLGLLGGGIVLLLGGWRFIRSLPVAGKQDRTPPATDSPREPERTDLEEEPPV